MRPLLKWAGGKYRQADMIDVMLRGGMLVPCAGTHIEPFIGAGAPFLRRAENGMVSRAVLGDANPKLIGMHAAVRNHPQQVINELRGLPTSLHPITGWRAAYKGVRQAFNDGPHEGAAHAARFIWLNRAGFNGLYRENKKGMFNVPPGKSAGTPRPLSLPSDEHILAVARLLKLAEVIVCADFRDVIAFAGKGDQVYCDPPYVPIKAGSFTSYSADGFTDRDQADLAAASLAAVQRGARVVVSNSDTAACRSLYADPAWQITELLASRSISRSGSRAPAKELMFIGGTP